MVVPYNDLDTGKLLIDMTENTIICTNCGAQVGSQYKFCTACGTPIRAPQPSVPPPPVPEADKGLIQGLKTKIRVVGDKAGNASKMAKGAVAPEKASAAVRNMLNVMTQVALDVERDLPPEMVKAVDLTAEINLIAFTIGVSIDLEQLRTKTF